MGPSTKRPSFTTVRALGKMRFNKSEVAALALGQPSHKFEKEGVLFVREKQEGFFRRSERTSPTKTKKTFGTSTTNNKTTGTNSLFSCYGGALIGKFTDGVSVERWCRLRGNLLFYFKSRDHWSEPAGVIVIEDCEIQPETNSSEATYGLVLTFSAGQLQHLATYTENERDSWIAALRSASHRQMRSHLEDLRSRLKAKTMNSKEPSNSSVIDPSEAPLCEMSISCDNLLCDALGRSPSAKIVISVRNQPKLDQSWQRHGQTEVSEKSSNPVFMRTIVFGSGMSDKTDIKMEAYDMRERYTSTKTLLGTAKSSIQEIKQSGRIRLKLESPNPDGRTAGFVTLNAWSFDSKIPASTDSTPVHQLDSVRKQQNHHHHKRSNSLPSALNKKARMPDHGPGMNLLFSNPITKTFRFHSGLAGDITVHELLLEPKISFAFPQQLLSLWICEEKELVHEIAGLGELKSPWHSGQMSWLENHLNIINTYSQALEALDGYKGPNFRKSSDKDKQDFEFVPVNLHLQRMWVENDSLRKSGTYDTITHGAFTSIPIKSPGLIKMLKELKAPQNDSNAWCSQSDRLQMAEDTLSAVRRVRREVVESMRMLMKAAKDKRSEGMFAIIEEMLRKTKCLCNLLDSNLVEETLTFLEDNRVTIKPEKLDEFSESVAEFMQRNKLKIDLPLVCRPRMLGPSLQTPCTEFVAKELRTPEVDLLFSPVTASQNSSAENSGEFWRTYSAYTSGYQSVDRLSDIDEFEESFRYLSVMDKTRHYYTLCRAASPVDTPPCGTPTKELLTQMAGNSNSSSGGLLAGNSNVIHEEDDEGIPEMEYEDEFLDPNSVEFSSSNHHPSVESNEICEEDKEKEIIFEVPNSAATSENTTTVEKNNSKNSTDQGLVNDSAGDEPEPIELTHLNVEAAMMCLASKVRLLCGKANSPTLSARTFRFKELDSKMLMSTSTSSFSMSNSAANSGNGNSTSSINNKQNSSDATGNNGDTNNFKIPDVPKPGGDLENIEDWTSELRPSMRKLRQGMDSLCKTAKLTCSILRLRQTPEAVQLSHQIKYRRDICFSHALTSLVTGLMTRLWCMEEHSRTFLNICIQLGPLVCFESLLSLYGGETPMFNDMIVVVEDLRNVEFNLILVDKRSKFRLKNKSSGSSSNSNNGSSGSNNNFSQQSQQKSSPSVPILEYHSFPLPRITGSRSSLKVLLPVPDYVYTMLPLEKMKTTTFSITPVLFNIGINEKATLGHKMGQNGPQEKNNIDNFKTLAEYYRRYNKLNLDQGSQRNKRFSTTFANEPDLDDLLAIMKDAVHTKKNKNVDILHLSSQICRRLHGLRFTNCKSGKDRTGMGVTLEQIQILSREYDLAEHEYQKALDAMRSEGTRIDTCEKNIGVKAYAFSTLQLTTFPYQYKAPVGSYQSNISRLS